MYCYLFQFNSVQLFSHVWLSAVPWTAACQASLSITSSKSMLKLMSIKLVMSSNHLILLPSIFPSIRVFSSESVLCIGGQSIGDSVSASVFPMNIQDWFPLGLTGWISLQSKGLSRVFFIATVQKQSILWHSVFFMVQFSHPYMITGKTIGLTRWSFVGKVMSLLFNLLSRLVIYFLPRSKCPLISLLSVSGI